MFEAILVDAGFLHQKMTISNENINSKEKNTEDLSIEVGTRTGKPANKNDMDNINKKLRFKTRVKAFYFLSNYWMNIKKTRKLPEIVRRALSPLKLIFEYQEEHIFDIIPERKSQNIKIEIKQLDESCKKATKKKGKKLRRKGSGQKRERKIVKQLSFILSALESQDETKNSDHP